MYKTNFEDFLSYIRDLQQKQMSFATITLVHSTGSTPQYSGARAIVGENGLLFGTIGGGALEKKAIDEAISYLKQNRPCTHFRQWNLQTDLGMACGRTAGLFFETFPTKSQWKIALFGAGHVVQELVPFLMRLECQLLVADSRAEWLDKLPQAAHIKKVLTEDLAALVSDLDPITFVAVITMGHNTDLPIVEKALQVQNFPFLGVIGSDNKAKILKAKLIERGISSQKASSVICPIGEEFGNNSPAEIALSITTQLVKKRDEFQSRGDR